MEGRQKRNANILSAAHYEAALGGSAGSAGSVGSAGSGASSGSRSDVP